MTNKRKRDELSDSDSDEITPGRQTLPVANLPCDFDQEPQDGMQYLFLVRRDARRLPHVTRVQNPYEVPETKVVATPPTTSNHVLPCEKWRSAFQTHFSNLRRNLTQPTIRVDKSRSCSKRRAVPEKKDRDAWWKFLAGYPESAWDSRARSIRKTLGTSYGTRAFVNPAEVVHPADATTLPDVQSESEPSRLPIACIDDLPRDGPLQPGSLVTNSTNSASFAAHCPISSGEVRKERIEQLSPPEVTSSYLQEIDHRMSIHLLMYFTHWINVHLQNLGDPLTNISISHGQWMFALLIKVEDQLSADEMNLLRNLARACLGLIRSRQATHAKNDATPEGTSSPGLVENTMGMSDASCWMIFTAIAGHWSQRDLWADAETTLVSA